MDPVIFHCKPYVAPVDQEFYIDPQGIERPIVPQATHTLAFEQYGDNGIIVGWAKAHESDGYNKKLGREIAVERIGHVINRLDNFSHRPIVTLDTISEDYLPSGIIDDSFDYYFQRAASKLIDLDNTEDVVMYFRTTRKNNTVCSIVLKSEQIKQLREAFWANSVVDAKDAAENSTSDYIFACFYNKAGDLMVAVQNRELFYANGLDLNVTDQMIAALDYIVTDDNGIIADNDDQILLVSEEMDELATIRYLSDQGLSYDGNLEAKFTSDVN